MNLGWREGPLPAKILGTKITKITSVDSGIWVESLDTSIKASEGMSFTFEENWGFLKNLSKLKCEKPEHEAICQSSVLAILNTSPLAFLTDITQVPVLIN